MAKLQAIEEQDAQKALTCRELLAKLGRYVVPNDSSPTRPGRSDGLGAAHFNYTQSWWR